LQQLRITWEKVNTRASVRQRYSDPVRNCWAIYRFFKALQQAWQTLDRLFWPFSGPEWLENKGLPLVDLHKKSLAGLFKAWAARQMGR
jgi:hypothetical protein